MKLPKKRPEQIKFSSEIDAQLLDAAKKLCKDRKIKLKEAIEFGLMKFIKASKSTK